MPSKIDRIKVLLTLVVLGCGLAVVLLETWAGTWLSDPARLALRSLFWVSAVLYFAARLFGRFKKGAEGPPESK